MEKAEFTFEGAITEDKPYIPFESFKTLPEGSVLSGTVDYVSSYKGYVKAGVLINGHTTQVTLWDITILEARALVGQPIKVKFNGHNEGGYPKLSVKW